MKYHGNIAPILSAREAEPHHDSARQAEPYHDSDFDIISIWGGLFFMDLHKTGDSLEKKSSDSEISL